MELNGAYIYYIIVLIIIYFIRMLEKSSDSVFFLKALYIWLDKLSSGSSFVDIQRNRRSTPELTLPSLPEKLYLTL